MEFISVIVATVVAMVVGSVWYSPIMFGTQWLKILKVKPTKDDVPMAMLLGTLSAFSKSLAIFVLLQYSLAETLVHALLLGFIIWFGIALQELAGNVIWAKSSKELLYINAGGSFVITICQVIIIWVLTH